MHGLPSHDGGRVLDWGRTSDDYAVHRPGPPESFYERLRALNVGRTGQRILDLGTGTGVLARRFARSGSRVQGLDVSWQQVDQARRLAREAHLGVGFVVAAAEALPFDDRRFDVVTANQCWLYFDRARAVPEVTRVLDAGGVLVTSHLCWLPRLDPIARATEDLVRGFNPDWSGADYAGEVPPIPPWAVDAFALSGMFVYDEPVPFTRDSWRGRIRACRGIGATLPADEVRLFDEALARLLERIAPETFTVLHRIDAHILRPRATGSGCMVTAASPRAT